VCCKPGLDDDTDRIRLIAQHIIQLESFWKHGLGVVSEPLLCIT
jgi:hypothetical protein